MTRSVICIHGVLRKTLLTSDDGRVFDTVTFFSAFPLKGYFLLEKVTPELKCYVKRFVLDSPK